GDQPRDIYNQRIHDLQTAIERVDVARDQVKACREHDGTLLSERMGIDYRACKKWLDIIHSVAKDLAVWEQADIKYHRRRHDDEDDDDDLNQNPTEETEEAVGELSEELDNHRSS